MLKLKNSNNIYGHYGYLGFRPMLSWSSMVIRVQILTQGLCFYGSAPYYIDSP
jgi:hypothetical protein